MNEENPLQRPSAHTLQVLFRALKWGRPAASQKWLDEKIMELNLLEEEETK